MLNNIYTSHQRKIDFASGYLNLAAFFIATIAIIAVIIGSDGIAILAH